MMKKRYAWMSALLIGTMMLGGCGKPAAPEGGQTTAAQTEKSEAAASEAGASDKSEKKEITIWYEGGDARLPFFQAVEAEMQKDSPNYSINAVTFDNSTFMTKVLQATAATGGVDLVFNDASRILEIDQQTDHGFMDLTDVLEANPNKDLVTDGDKLLSSVNGALAVMPVNRTIAGLGVKTDVQGVEVNEETLPSDWEKFTALGEAYKKAGIPGFTMHLGADPGQAFNLFMCGSGMQDVFLNGTPESQVGKNKEYFTKIISVYAGENGFWDKDAPSEDFAAMYNKIQSGSVGMFRVGNWNAGNWDKADSGVGEYTVTTFPGMNGTEGGLVLLNTRGFAIPKNSENVDAAKVYLSYVLNKDPQTKSFETMGSCMDNSVVDTGALSKNQKIFFDGNVKVYPIDNYVAEFSYYNAIKDAYEKGIINAFNSKSEDEISANVDQLDESLTKVIGDNK